MNNETHTPEPWEVLSIEPRLITVSGSEASNRTVFHIRFPDGKGGWSELTGEDEANARRIVACVNACAGLSTVALEDGHQPMIKTSRLRRERDELAAALRRCLSHFENIRAADADDTPMMLQARAALAKLKKEAT